MTRYRIDRFELPAAVREEFLAAVEHIQDLLGRQPGFEHDLLVEESLPDARLAVVTVAAWRDEDAVAGARVALEQDRAATGFDPAALMARLGVSAQFGLYRPVIGVTATTAAGSSGP